jgi:hypothetical protein
VDHPSSGNTQSDGVNSYTWNAESQLKSGGGVNYLYDGDGRKVPHYHRRIVGPDGKTVPGGGIGRHRPWQKPPSGKFLDRF